MDPHSRSPVRGRSTTAPAPAAVGSTVYLLSTEENEARGALQDHLQRVILKYNDSFHRADLRLLPAGPHDRDREYYIFPFFCAEVHSVGFLENYIRSELDEALAGRKVSIRCIRDRSTGDTRFYIDIATRSPEITQPNTGSGRAKWEFMIFVLLGILGLIGAHQYRTLNNTS